MTNYDMRVGERIDKKPMDKNGCYPFTQKSIDNIPNINIFTDTNINNEIIKGCKEVLHRSMDKRNPYRYGEQGLLISIMDMDCNGNRLPHIHEVFNGEYHKIRTDERYRNIVTNRPIKDLIFIHNHPNNSSFSAEDLKSLTSRKSMLAVVAIGNRHNIFVVINYSQRFMVNNFIMNYMREYQKKNGIVINKVRRKNIEDEAARQILNSYDKFQLDYYKFRRKSQ